MDNLNLQIHILAYNDTESGTTNNPMRRVVDWTRRFSGLEIAKPQSNIFTIEPGQTLDLFSGIRSTSVDNTTAFDMELLSTLGSVYRFQHSAGTNPVFRTKRAIGGDIDSEITVTINNNATAKFEHSDGAIVDFGTVQVGDVLRIAGSVTGDPASSFSSYNHGYWTVLSVDTDFVVCKRPTGEAFRGVAEQVILGDDFATDFTIYSSSGVQIGDSVEISAGFSSVTQQTFIVSQVGPDYFEVVSTEPLPIEVDIIPGINGLSFYTSAKQMIYLEVDNDAIIRLNGDTGNAIKLNPLSVADPLLVATYQQIGVIYALQIENRSKINTLNGFYVFIS